MRVQNTLLVAILGLAFVGAFSSQAKAGGEAGGGGDMCEDRIKIIRDDLRAWIENGGPAGLKLPEGISNQYSQLMLNQISVAKIKCVGEGDEGYPVKVKNTPKVCRFDLNDRASQITCDFKKFNSTIDSDQYVQIHHEYAGLAGIEPPNEDDSNYHVSNQISDFLVSKVVKVLAIKPATTPGLIWVHETNEADEGICRKTVSENEVLETTFNTLLKPSIENTLSNNYFSNGIKVISISSKYQPFLNPPFPVAAYIEVYTTVKAETVIATYKTQFPIWGLNDSDNGRVPYVPRHYIYNKLGQLDSCAITIVLTNSPMSNDPDQERKNKDFYSRFPIYAQSGVRIDDAIISPRWIRIIRPLAQPRIQ